MKRHKILETMISFFKPNDIVIFCGKEVTKEALTLDKNNFYYVDDSYGLGVALGIAMCTNKRVFVICRDADLISDLSVMVQAAASRLKNIFYVILNDGCYQEINNHPTLTGGIYSLRGTLFNYGLVLHDFSHFFKGRVNKKLLDATIERLAGPMAIIIKTSTMGLKESEHKLPKNLDARIASLIIDDSKGTSLFRR